MDWSPDLKVIAAERRARLARLGGYPKPPIIRRLPTQEDILRAELAAMEARAEAARIEHEKEEAARQAASEAARRQKWAGEEALAKYLAETPHTFSTLAGVKIKVPWAQAPRVPSNMRFLANYVARQFGLDYDAILSASRVDAYVKARQAAQTATVILFPTASLPMIGQIFNRDHTTVLYAAWSTIGRRYQEAAAAIRERWRAEAEAAIAAAIAVRP